MLASTPQVDVADHQRLRRELVEQLLGDVASLERVGLGKHDRELVAADSGEQVRATQPGRSLSATARRARRRSVAGASTSLKLVEVADERAPAGCQSARRAAAWQSS